jgi:FixJ family two-component response regulator
MSDGRVVCIVDDDEAVRHGGDSLLRSIGLPVSAFESAEDFLSSDWVQMARCLILDLQDAGMGGLELRSGSSRMATESRSSSSVPTATLRSTPGRWRRARSRSCRSRSMERPC